ncbi:MAG: FkbM family methyltransferase [Phycisphaeraceae bacterium]
MKAKELAYLLGLKPKPRTYGYTVRRFELPKDGVVEYAQWSHPREALKEIRQEVVNELRTFLRPGDVAIDIGAHAGDTTVPMALAVGPGGCVLALEPNRYVFPVLEANARLNLDKTRIIPLMIAATPRDEAMEFEYSDSGFCNGGRHEGINRWRHAHAFKLRVDGRHLPSLLQHDYAELVPRIRFIKVDAEGYDFAILQSLSDLLRQTRCYVKAEVFRHTDQATREAMFDFLSAQGYTIRHVAGDANYHGQVLTAADTMRWPHFDVFCEPA